MEGEVALPFRSAQAGVLSYMLPLQRTAAIWGSVLLLVVSIIYVYGVISSVMHVASREEIAIQITKASSEVGRLEAEYLARTDGITESFAKEKGYVAISERSFVEQVSGVTYNSTR